MRLRLYGRPDPRPDQRACSNVSQTAASAHVEAWHTARRYRAGRMWPHIVWPHVAMVIWEMRNNEDYCNIHPSGVPSNNGLLPTLRPRMK